MKHFMVLAATLTMTLCIAPANATTGSDEGPGVIYAVGASHLDTQWWWTIQETIDQLLAPTFADTLDLLDRYPGFQFSWEGAFRYMLLKEYYPDVFFRTVPYIESGRWFPGGSAVEAGDVNIPSPESLIRQFLYGNRYFQKSFGKTSTDVFLPDCFGFGWALPSVAAHCGIRGFSTQKLEWGGAIPIPFGIGVWKGPDGASVLAALNPGSYTTQLEQDPGLSPRWISALDAQEAVSGLRLAFMYFGVGDRGGSPGESSVALLETATAREEGPKVVVAPSDQIFRDLDETEVAALPVYDGELIMRYHGTGSYTAQSAMKRYNRRNEQLADAAERASVIADWLGTRDYPTAALESEWIRFLWHQFHDDLTGTSIPEAYQFSWNDELLTMNRFTAILQDAVGATASLLDTRTDGLAVVVFNPLAFEREDVVATTLTVDSDWPGFVKVIGPEGREVPSQVTGRTPGEGGMDRLEIIFLANAPSTGFIVYDIRPSTTACQIDSGLKGNVDGLENHRYKVVFDTAGNISSVYDKLTGRELLSAPAGIEFFMDMSFIWPAWEVHYEGLRDGPLEILGGTPELKAIETGPVRVTYEVVRTDSQGSTFTQRVSLAAKGAGDIVRVDNVIDWRSFATLAKATFPVTSGNPEATYDLGLGTIRRGINTPDLFEVPAQQWADLTAGDNSFGVSIINDSKYGWDHPDEERLRLTLIHTPAGPTFHHHTIDFGVNHTTWAIYGHGGDWRNGTPRQAARLNQPLAAFLSAIPHDGALGRKVGLLTLEGPDADQVAVKAIKKDEDGRGLTIVRLQELHGRSAADVRIQAAGIISEAFIMDGMEISVGSLEITDGQAVLGLAPYQIASIGLRIEHDGSSIRKAASRFVALPYNVDVVSTDENRADGAFDSTGASWSSNMWPANFTYSGVVFQLGPVVPGIPNAVKTRGQKIDLEIGTDETLYMLAAADEDVPAAVFKVGEDTYTFPIQAWTGFIGQWDSRVVGDTIVETRDEMLPAYLKQAPVALYGTHRHGPDGDHPYVFTYMFMHALKVRPGETSLVLPDDPRIKILAVTLSPDASIATRLATSLFDMQDPIAAPGWHEPDPIEPVQPEVVEDACDIIQDTTGDAIGDITQPPDTARPDATADASTDVPASSGGCSAGGSAASDSCMPVLFVFLLGTVLSTRFRSRAFSNRGRRCT